MQYHRRVMEFARLVFIFIEVKSVRLIRIKMWQNYLFLDSMLGNVGDRENLQWGNESKKEITLV